VDTRRRDLFSDAPRSGWRYWVQVWIELGFLAWVPLVLIAMLVLLVRMLL